MYSVNIDKLVEISSEEKQSFAQIADNITNELSKKTSIAIIGGKVDNSI